MRKIVTIWQLVFILFNLLFIGNADGLSGQVLFTPDEIKSANTAATANYMSDDEKNVILIMNLARIDGQKFYQSYILSFVILQNSLYSTKILANNKYLLSLKSDLQKIKGANILSPSQCIVGVSIAPHKIYGYNCVIDFSCNSIPQ
jgi:hypothetical protein